MSKKETSTVSERKIRNVSERKIRNVSIKTDGMSRDEILKCIGNHVSACQKAVATLWAREGETEAVAVLRASLQTAFVAVHSKSAYQPVESSDGFNGLSVVETCSPLVLADH